MLRRLYSTFQEGDVVLIRPLKNVAHTHLSRPLARDRVVHTHYGDVHHNDIIGQPKRVFLGYRGRKHPDPDSKRKVDPKTQRFVVTEPMLDEYTSLVKRKAQPIYTMDANTIVLLADIDVEIPEYSDNGKHNESVNENGNENQENQTSHPKYFLEAGTGNGSLTLSVCSAIHGANALARHFNDPNLRGALLVSLDRREDHQKMAAWNVQNYKRGKFAGDVEFQVCDPPSQWAAHHPHLPLSGVFLDLPDPHLHLGAVSRQMCLDATLIVFCPSVTQILQCRETLAASKLQNTPIDLVLVKTVELPPGNGGGTREWDVNTVFTRETGEKVSVCRPKVGARVVGGGFVGVFKRASVIGRALKESLEETEARV